MRTTIARPNLGGNGNKNRLMFKFDELFKTLESSNSEIFSNYLEKCLNVRYTHFNFVRDIIHNWAMKLPTTTALWSCEKDNEYKFTFKEILDYSSGFANTLTGKYYNLKPGNTVNENYYCTAKKRTSQLTFKDIRYHLLASGTDCIITDEANVEEVIKAIENPVRPIICGLIDPKSIRLPFGWMNLYLNAMEASKEFDIFDSKASTPALSIPGYCFDPTNVDYSTNKDPNIADDQRIEEEARKATEQHNRNGILVTGPVWNTRLLSNRLSENESFDAEQSVKGKTRIKIKTKKKQFFQLNSMESVK
ncbi:unnamed protein product, partial [Didymodactylos carnosus]